MSGPEWRLDAVRAPFVYGPPVARYLWALKYRAERHLGRPLGQLLGDAIVRVELDIDAIVGVPLHPRRLRLRTFNQADEIAAPVAARLGRRLLGSGLRRSIQTQPQAELDRKTRLKAPLECFTVDRNLAGLRVAIVDDVITTGATVNALASALKSSGAVHVEAWSVARSIGKATGPGYSIRKI